MNAKQIQIALFDTFASRSATLVSNYTPKGWFECDIMRLTKSGYMEEFEIKLTASDFKADALKTEMVTRYRRLLGTPARTKHQRLAEGDSKGPCRFWFVVSDTLFATLERREIEVPSWAGVILAHENKRGVRLRMCGEGFRKAPQLHSVKANPAILEHTRTVHFWRFWQLAARNAGTSLFSTKYDDDQADSSSSAGQAAPDQPQPATPSDRSSSNDRSAEGGKVLPEPATGSPA